MWRLIAYSPSVSVSRLTSTVLSEPAYGLPNVTAGSSDSMVDVSLDTLTDGEYAINLHMSDDDLATYTSCGEID